MLNFLLETFRLGLKNLRLHKLRSLLTALGIIIGVAAVIAMVAIGEGAKQSAIKQVAQLGANNILVRSVKPPESTESNTGTTVQIRYGILRDDLARLQTLSGIDAVVPLRDTEQRVVHGPIKVSAPAIGTEPELFEVIQLRAERGRVLEKTDCDNASPVCVLGAIAAQQLFPYEDPLGQTIQVGSVATTIVTLQVVGVLEPTGLGKGVIVNRELDLDIYFPRSLAWQSFSDFTVVSEAGRKEQKHIELTEVWLHAKRMEEVEYLAGACENLLSQFHERKDYEVKAPIEILRSAERTQRIFNYIMVLIAGLSLVVGGIGIMNIMLAAVTERTREIGIRRALGAKRRHITLQFLIETTVISLTGGLIGVAFGCALALSLPVVVKWFGADYPTSIALWSVVSSFVISGATGIIFGMYPAVMAAKMNPIEALRHE